MISPYFLMGSSLWISRTASFYDIGNRSHDSNLRDFTVLEKTARSPPVSSVITVTTSSTGLINMALILVSKLVGSDFDSMIITLPQKFASLTGVHLQHFDERFVLFVRPEGNTQEGRKAPPLPHG